MNIAIAVLAMTLPPPASGDLACIVEQVPLALRLEAIQEATSAASGPVQRRLVEIGLGCARQRNWTPSYAANTTLFAVATLLRGDGRDILQREGIPIDVVDRWLEQRFGAGGLDRDSLALARDLSSELAESDIPSALLAANIRVLAIYVMASQELIRQAAQTD